MNRRKNWFSLCLKLSLFILMASALIGCSDAAEQQPPDVTSQSAVKIAIDETGVYKVSLDQLKSTGLQLDSISVDNVNLTNNGAQVPYYIADDGLVFYAESAESRFSLLQSYILRTGEAGLLMSETPAATADAAAISAVPQTVRREENLRYEQRAAEMGVEVWYWEKILHTGSRSQFEFTIELPAITGEFANLQLQWWGLSFNDEVELDHDIDILINGVKVDTVQFNDQEFHLSSTDVSTNLLNTGENTITLDNSERGAARVDQVYLDWASMTYDSPTTAINDALIISNSAGAVSANGFSAQPLLIDATDALAPTLLTGWDFNTDTASFGVDEASVVAAVGPNGFRSATSITALLETNFRDTTNQADLLIVTTKAHQSALEPLITARQEQGLSVVVARVDELYDEFGYGQNSPDAIKNFVTYAYENWAEPKPSYLFLVGDATIDTLGYAANNPDDPLPQPQNVVPSAIVEVSYSGETVSDARLADVDGDNRPDLAVGRWPVDTAAEVKDLVERTLAYESGVSAENSLFAIDGSSQEFTNFTNQIVENSEFGTDNALLFDGPTSTEVAESWNDGAWLVSYVGHGGLKLWGKDEIFTKDAVGDIGSNGQPPIVLQFSCLTGHFAEITTESISETMLKQEGGPVLIVASTGLTLSTHQSPFATELLAKLSDPNTKRMGDAFQAAKMALDIDSNGGLQEISDTFGLIGDPSAIIVRPSQLAAATP